MVLESPYDLAGSPLARGARPARGARLLLWSLAAVAVVMAGLWARSVFKPAPAPRVMKVSVNVPRTDYIDVGFQQGAIAIAQDAKAIAYTARRDGKVQLFVRRLDENAATVVPGSEGAHNPFFSPDGQWIAFFAGEKLKKAFVRGGEPLELLAAAQDRGGAWLQDGSIVVAPSTASPLVRISSSGGAAEALTELDANRKERTHRWPCALPGGEWLLFVIGTIDRPGDYDHAAVSAFSLKTKERRDVFYGCEHGEVFALRPFDLGAAETLYAAPFDLGNTQGNRYRASGGKRGGGIRREWQCAVRRGAGWNADLSPVCPRLQHHRAGVDGPLRPSQAHRRHRPSHTVSRDFPATGSEVDRCASATKCCSATSGHWISSREIESSDVRSAQLDAGVGSGRNRDRILGSGRRQSAPSQSPGPRGHAS